MKKFAKICLAVLLAAAMLLAPATASATEFTDDLMQALAAKVELYLPLVCILEKLIFCRSTRMSLMSISSVLNRL